MSSRIKKTLFFSTKEACLFYYCDLPLGYRIIKRDNSPPQPIGDLVCILVETGQVFISKIASKPNLNPHQEWNESFFRKLFEAMQNFKLLEPKNQQDDYDLELESTSQSNSTDKKYSSNSKILQVLDPTLKQETYLLRCLLKQFQFHKGRIGIHRLWQEFQKYGKLKRKQEQTHQKRILELQQRKQEKFKQMNKLLTKENKKKNILRENLTQIWREKINKLNQLSIGRQHLLPQLMSEFNRYEQQSSMNVSEISNSDILNSQDDRPLTGSLFDPSQSYHCKQQNKIQEENHQ